jgi:hypothetical protein
MIGVYRSLSSKLSELRRGAPDSAARALVWLAPVLASVLVLCATAADARGPAAAPRGVTAEPQATCVVHSLPSFVAQGEETSEQSESNKPKGEGTAATVADVIEIECNPSVYGTGSKIKVIAAQLFSRCKGKLTWYVPNPYRVEEGRGISLELDADGSATVALLAGPGCMAGESLVTVHMEEQPFETFATAFTVLAPVTTPPGVFALPSTQVEDARSSGVATIVQAEFENGSEKLVHIGSEELLHRCRIAPHLHWILMNREERTGVAEVTGVRLDNDGNAFVIAVGDASCAPGTSMIEADLESKPFTTLMTNFTILPPQPTAEPSFTIEKRQEIAGSGSGFTVAPLKASIGQTVDYEILVKNTGSVPETFSEFTDAHCDPKTIEGGPGSSAVAPGETTVYTCHHVISQAGVYINEATVTATTVSGKPVTLASNEVLVEAAASKPGHVEVQKPSFTIEKLQRVAGSGGGFTASPLAAEEKQTIEYEIVVKNTGTVLLELTNFSDPHCDLGTIAPGPGAIAIAPGASTTYTCRHVLTSANPYVNEATVTATAQGFAPLTQPSNQVVVTSKGVLPCEPASMRVHGATGSKTGRFAVRIASRAVTKITVLLDGRRLTTLTPSSANGGTFTIKLDARRLRYGVHKLSANPAATDPKCGVLARTSVFVRPRPPSPPTG